MRYRIVAFAVGLIVAFIVGANLATYLEVDACADAGGSYIAVTGACVVPVGVEYVAQFSRPGLYAFWVLFLLAVFVPAWAATRLVLSVAARIAKR